MSVRPPEAARYRAAAVTASSAFHGSAIPSPFASTPQRSQVDGMNCIQPIAPAELGPMFSPKFDSTLLIAASTFQGMAYAAPARCQTSCRAWRSSRCVSAGGLVNETGTEMAPGLLGTVALGSETELAARGLEDTVKPRTGGCAWAAPARRASAAAATTRRRISLRLGRGGVAVLPALGAVPPPASAALPDPSAPQP